MPWSHLVETMGFEPTTPCLQTVQLVAVEPGDLLPARRRVAWPGLAQTAGVAHLWPEISCSQTVWRRAVPTLIRWRDR
jgi:hypothetical protein